MCRSCGTTSSRPMCAGTSAPTSELYTLHLSQLASKVFAFEPVPHSVDTLRFVTKRARLDNVVISQLALSDRVGRARMAVPTDGFYGGFYLARLDTGGELDVEVSTIDALIASGVPEPDFIKCDVEGAELLVLAGATRLLARRRPIWLLETFDDAVVDRVRSFGYSGPYARWRQSTDRGRNARPRAQLLVPAEGERR